MSVTVERLQAEVDADSSRAEASLLRLDAVLTAAARDRRATIDIDVDEASASQAFADVASAAAQAGQAAGGAFAGAADVIGDVGGAAAGAAPKIADMGGAAGGAASGMQGMSSSGANLLMNIITLIPQIAMAGIGFMALYSAATVAAGALQMLAASAVGLVAALAPLVGLLGAIPVGLGAIGGGIGTLIAGFSGINKAVSAMDKQQAASTQSTFNATAAARELKSARQGIVEATKAVARAEKELARAQEGVAKARKEAARDLLEMQRALRDAAWAEEDAAERLRRAQEHLAKVQAGLGDGAKDLSTVTDDFTGKVYEIARVSGDMADEADRRKDAEREVIRAQEELMRVQERRKDLEQDALEMQKKGIEGSDKVVDAIRRVEDAQLSLSRAHDNVAAANERLARVQEENARRAAGGAAANRALAEAMDALSPAGKKFAKFIHEELKPALKDIQQIAQEGLLPGVQRGLEALMGVLPLFKTEMKLWAEASGAAIEEVMKHFASDALVSDLKELSTLFREVMFGDDKKKTSGLADALIPIADILIAITKAAGPMTKMITNDLVKGLNKLSAWMKKPENAEKMEKFFTGSYEMLKLWGGVLKPLAGIFSSLVTAARPLAEWMLKGLGSSLEDINKSLSSPDGMKKLSKFFEDAKPAIKEVGGMLLDLVKALFVPKAQGEDSAFVTMIKAIREDLIPALTDMFSALSEDKETGGGFIEFLTGIVKALTWMIENRHLIIGLVGVLMPVWVAAYNLIKAWGDANDEMGKFGKKMEEGYTKFSGLVSKFASKIREFGAIFGTIVGAASPGWGKFIKWISEKLAQFLQLWSSTGSFKTAFIGMLSIAFTELYNSFARAVNKIVKGYNSFAKVVPGVPEVNYTMPVITSGGDSGGKSLKGGLTKQYGGKVEPGKTYIVGEKRPELLTMPEGMGGRIAAAVPREAMESTGAGLTEEQLSRLLDAVLEKAKPNVDLRVDQREHADPALISREVAWAIR